MNPYVLIIGASLILILSFFFSLFARKTKIPSVLMLIVLGIFLNLGAEQFNINLPDLFPVLEILGIVGLIMIVLEGALELEIDSSKKSLISSSLLIATLGLVLSIGTIAFVLKGFYELDMLRALVYATPLGVISSAIVIPSISALSARNKEFMIYESTFSDILGIMVFYFLLGLGESTNLGSEVLNFSLLSLLTLVISGVLSFALILAFQRISGETKLFLLIATLILIYSIGKLFHLSSLLLILIFGLFLKNHTKIFKKWDKSHLQKGTIQRILDELEMITKESAFVVRTFFFVVFGMTIDLMSIVDTRTILLSLIVLAVIFLSRFILFKFFRKGPSKPMLYIAPRGLITILLFYAIPASMNFPGFSKGVLLLVILVTSVIMSWGLIKFPDGEKIKDVVDDENDPQLRAAKAIINESGPLTDGVDNPKQENGTSGSSNQSSK